MLKFSKLLHCKGFHITFVNTEFNDHRFLRSRSSNSLDGLPDFRFITIPDGLPPSDLNATQDVTSLCDSIMKNFLAPFSDLLRKLHNVANNPLMTCIVSDGFKSLTVTAAHELGIPIAMLFTISACSLMACMHFSHLRDIGFTPLEGITKRVVPYQNLPILFLVTVCFNIKCCFLENNFPILQYLVQSKIAIKKYILF
jgi:hypothetical protein